MQEETRAAAERAASVQAAADGAQRTLDRTFSIRAIPGAALNVAPPSLGRLPQLLPLNHWWLSHLVDARLDAFHRTGDERRLRQAESVLRLLRIRNRGLANDYFDDMGWLTLALIGLFDATADPRHLRDAETLWQRIRTRGWNDHEGPSVAWREQQPDYKNAPSNGTFALASARLHARTGDPRYRVAADETVAWLQQRLVAEDGTVLDGVNRQGDHRVDTDWVFSYDQGVVAAAVLERAWVPDAPAAAARIARAALPRLAPHGLVEGETARADHPGGGDAGLFKGIHVRYLAEVAAALPTGADRETLTHFIAGSTDALIRTRSAEETGRVGDDWSRPAPPVTFLSTQLAATLALEARWRLDRTTPAPVPA
ncbi:glycoside hydrolase family 76 protein [Herbiconiux flava]|uniref:Putative alpha-1,6-mannanase (GH76 family) n=1 Tax=Herbiconiux flava TaxID=881268 RepID=A0A852SQN7_9MICO|nr:glycoside hydrolase family 76 protein [Herbiconiux flava]NYD71151.1 putative alpha-1,6-mannanase (GH76 family) [Herbiconiux flava]GLK18886.1 glycoside hydrolase [Herbiconiux flava]